MKKNIKKDNKKSLKGKSAKSYLQKLANDTKEKSTKKATAQRQSPHSSHLKKQSRFSDSLIEGVMDYNLKGFGFVSVKGFDEDVFIPASKMNGAMHKDTVLIKMISSNRGGGEGEVVEILERGFERVVGTFKNAGNYSYVIPNDVKFAPDISIKKGTEHGAIDGDKVVVSIKSFSHKISGEVLEVLGKSGEPNADMMAIIRSYGLYETFPKSVLAEAERIQSEVTEQETLNRADFTNDLVITIDGEDSRDFDDAINLKMTEDGLFELSVHIADVSHYVAYNSKLDKEAYKRGTSVYFPDLVLPMLPPKLSNGICSLNEGVERLVLSCIMYIDNIGNVIKYKIKEGVIKSTNRMTYNQTAKILDGDKELSKKYKHIVPMLQQMHKLSQILTNKRLNRGAIEFDLTESEIVLDENDKVCEIRKRPRLITHRLIEEFMLVANETIAEHMFNLNAPFVFRAHEPPPAPKIEGLTDFLNAIGFKTNFSETPAPKEFAELLKNAPSELSAVISRVALRSMSKATYEPENKAHFGLAAPFYCHFTSPIRRYPDLVIHRIIKDYLHNGKKCFKKYVEFTHDASEQSSVKERSAEKAERDVDDLKKAEYMSDKIGEVFEGIISGVTEWGFYVELENSCEGLVRVETLNGYFTYNMRTMSLSNGAITHRMGDKVTIKVDSVLQSKINFILENQ